MIGCGPGIEKGAQGDGECGRLPCRIVDHDHIFGDPCHNDGMNHRVFPVRQRGSPKVDNARRALGDVVTSQGHRAIENSSVEANIWQVEHEISRAGAGDASPE